MWFTLISHMINKEPQEKIPNSPTQNPKTRDGKEALILDSPQGIPLLGDKDEVDLVPTGTEIKWGKINSCMVSQGQG